MFAVVLALIQVPTFTNVCIRVRLIVCVFLNTAPLVCCTDASIKICVNSNMDNNTTTSANVCTHIFTLNFSVGNSICIRLLNFLLILMLAPISVFISVYRTILVRVSSSISSTCSISMKCHIHPYQNSSSFYVIDANIKTAVRISIYSSTSTPSTSMDIRITIFVLIFVLSVRIKQVILFLWINVFNCSDDVNRKACVAICTY